MITYVHMQRHADGHSQYYAPPIRVPSSFFHGEKLVDSGSRVLRLAHFCDHLHLATIRIEQLLFAAQTEQAFRVTHRLEDDIYTVILGVLKVNILTCKPRNVPMNYAQGKTRKITRLASGSVKKQTNIVGLVLRM